jgi:hypothetical protein
LCSSFTNIGDVGNGPYFENDKLKLRYDDGDICLNPEGPDHISTVITFECDHSTVCTVLSSTVFLVRIGFPPCPPTVFLLHA